MSVRVEYFIDHLNVGGAQRHLVHLLEALDRTRFTPQVCVGGLGGALVPAIERLGVPVRAFGVGGTLARPGIGAAFVRTARRLRRDQVAIVHGYMYLGNIMGMLAAALARTPVRLASKRSLDRYPRRAQLAASRLANRCADRIVCNADAVRRFVLAEERPRAERLCVIPNGIQNDGRQPAAERPQGVRPGVPVVGAIGRLTWKKAYPDLLAAAARVRAARPEVEFVVVGDGPLRAELEAEAARRGVPIHFLGEREQVGGLLRGFDVFVISSIIEGMPNVLLEALAAERPVVATRAGGIPEIVSHERSGLLVDPGQPAALADGILRLLGDRDEGARLGAEGRRTVEARFSITAMVEQYEQLYTTLLAEKGLLSRVRLGPLADVAAPGGAA